jgi:hypothetical protein
MRYSGLSTEGPSPDTLEFDLAFGSDEVHTHPDTKHDKPGRK